MLILTEAWKTAYPQAAVGILAMRNVVNPREHPALEEERVKLEQDLRTRFAGQGREALKALPTIQAYTTYYKPFRKTYHVLLQLESVALKGKSIMRVSSLVETMFMAELKNQLLTAGHDLGVVREPMRVDVADGSESYVRINGQEQTLKAGDMAIADVEGVLSSIIYGPDRRTQIRPETREVLFTVYGPEGIERQAIHRHLEDIRRYVTLVVPEAEVEQLEVYTAT